jgi:predicted phosphodiesterase
MRLALLADLHANREACLSKLRRLGFDRAIVLGDIVGYGADPEWAIEAVQALVADGGIAIYGNHDEAVLRDAAADARSTRHLQAQAAIDWTRERLSPAHREALAAWPPWMEDDDRLYVHANA